MNTDINYVFKKWTSVEATHEKLFALSNRQTKKYLSMNIWSSFIRYSLNLWNKINIPTYPTTVLTLTHERAYSNFFHCKMAWGMFSKKYYNITIHSTPQSLSFSSACQMRAKHRRGMCIAVIHGLTGLMLPNLKFLNRRYLQTITSHVNSAVNITLTRFCMLCKPHERQTLCF